MSPLRLLTAACVLALAATLHAQVTFDDADRAFVDSLLAAKYPADGPGAVALVGVGGVPVYRKAQGLASVELNVPLHVGNVLHIGSISKQFASVALGQLADAGKLKFSDPITKYLPDYDTHGRTITLQQLLSHTSGIPSYTELAGFEDWADEPMAIDTLIALFEAEELLFEPGTDWSYSNSGYVLAARVVEAIDGRGFNAYVQAELFDRAGMFDADFGTKDRIIPGMAYGYGGPGEGVYVPAAHFDLGWTYGAGQIVSSVDDMLKWDNALRSGKLIQPSTLKQLYTPYTLADGRSANYAGGWSAREVDGVRFVTHGGALPGFLAQEISVPERELYVVVLSNNGTFRPTDIARAITMRALDRPTDPAPEVAMTGDQLRDYEGVYAVHLMGSRLATNMSDKPVHNYLRVREDTLFANMTGGKPSPLVATARDHFRPEDGYTVYAFQRDASGKVNRLDIYDESIQYGPDEREPLTAIPLPAEKKAVELPAATLARYAGRYEKGTFLKASVKPSEEGLTLEMSGETMEMLPSDETHFFNAEEGVSMRFEPSGDKAYKLVFEGGREYVLERM